MATKQQKNKKPSHAEREDARRERVHTAMERAMCAAERWFNGMGAQVELENKRREMENEARAVEIAAMKERVAKGEAPYPPFGGLGIHDIYADRQAHAVAEARAARERVKQEHPDVRDSDYKGGDPDVIDADYEKKDGEPPLDPT